MIGIDLETGRRFSGRPRMDAATIMIEAALGIMFLALLLAAASVRASPLPVPDAPIARPAEAMLILRGADGSLATLAPVAAEVIARVDPRAARVTVRHRFRTGSGAARAGVYFLPLPADARPRRLELAVGARRFEIGLAAERTQAAPELLALPIEAIGADAEISVQITYEQAVTLDNGRFVLALPLPRGGGAPRITSAGWGMPGVSLRLELDPGLPIAELRSPSHGIDIERGPGERRHVVLADSEPADRRDFILVWKPADPDAPIAALRRYAAAQTQAQEVAEDVLMLRVRPIGPLLAFVPALPRSASPTGSPIDDGSVLTAVAAKSGSPRPQSGSMISTALGASILTIWACGAFYLAARRSADGASSATSQTGIPS